MESIRLVARNGEAVCQALEHGEVLHLDTASEEMTDEFLLFAIESGLLQQWADGFPDPRNWSEIGCEVIPGGGSGSAFCEHLLAAQDGLCLALGARVGGFGIQLGSAGGRRWAERARDGRRSTL